jgi:multicomponent Na+:H+ antiporter subunit A
VALKPFLGPEVETPKHAHEGPVLLWLGPLFLAVTGLVAALFSTQTHALFSSPMASAVAGEATTVTIGLIPGIGMALLLSVITVILGIVIYRGLDWTRDRIAGTLTAIGWGPDRGFDQAIAGIIRLSAVVTRVIQNGRLDTYVTITFVAIAAGFLIPIVFFDGCRPGRPSRCWPSTNGSSSPSPSSVWPWW